jgi:predicted regulator of Ras-like GTPase activity (Roadblock/LC7/MglB family)
MARFPTLMPESPRDQVETGFTPILRWLFDVEPHVVGLVFVDRDGECVDYCSGLDPFDTKVTGAHMAMVLGFIRERLHVLAAGEPISFVISSSGRDLVVRRLDDEYTLVTIVKGGMVDDSVLAGVEGLVARLRKQSSIEPPWWDGHGLVVRVREAVGWEYAPAEIVLDDKTVPITAVLGRWEESGGLIGGTLVCFRIRTADQREMTLAYDVGAERWYRW